MKTLVLKELRENVKLAVLGLVIYVLMLAVQYRNCVVYSHFVRQPLTEGDLLWSTAWFCGIFGAVLGWLQLHNERRPDLWAFLLHRPITRSQIFLGKSVAGLALYAVAVGVPLLVFIIWAVLPGHVAAPFELRMLRPLAAFILLGAACYFAGMLAGLRQVRWYGSRGLGLGMAIAVCVLMWVQPCWWVGFLAIPLGAAILIAANLGGFQTHGYYRGQPAWGKAALIIALMSGSAVVAVFCAVLVANFLLRDGEPRPWTRYAMTQDGTIYKVTAGQGEQVVDLEGKPAINPKTGRMFTLAELEKRTARRIHLGAEAGEGNRREPWPMADLSSTPRWHTTPDTQWFYWHRYDKLVGYNIARRSCIGSLGPDGFSPDVPGPGKRFDYALHGLGYRTLSTPTTVYRVDYEKRSVRPLFTTTSDDPIVSTDDISSEDAGWEYTAVITKRFVHLLAADGRPVWKVSYEPQVFGQFRPELYVLEPPDQFALWMAPTHQENQRAGWKLPTPVVWLARGQGVARSADLPALPHQPPRLRAEDALICTVTPPAGVLVLPWLQGGPDAHLPPLKWLLINWAVAVLLCLPIGWWLGRRYRFSLGAQVGWAVFHVLCGVPGLLAFLSVQEWPARVPCRNCKRPRLVDRSQCEHCGADFPQPEKTGTEVFAPLVPASQRALI
jgi:hypothetical protein